MVEHLDHLAGYFGQAEHAAMNVAVPFVHTREQRFEADLRRKHGAE
jgi:hypothetical protein